MNEDLIFTKEDIEKYLRPVHLEKPLYELFGIIKLSKQLDEKRGQDHE